MLSGTDDCLLALLLGDCLWLAFRCACTGKPVSTFTSTGSSEGPKRESLLSSLSVLKAKDKSLENCLCSLAAL